MPSKTSAGQVPLIFHWLGITMLWNGKSKGIESPMVLALALRSGVVGVFLGDS